MTTTATHTASGYTDPYPGRKGNERVREDCGRCAGTGVYDGKSGHKFHTPAVGFETTGCFYCHGNGYTTRLVSSARQTARAQAKRNAEAAAAEEANKALAAERIAEQAPTIEALTALINEPAGKLGQALYGYVYDLGSFNPNSGTPLWGKDDADRAARLLAEYEARRATLTTCPEGKLEIEGKVLAIKWQDGYMPGSSVQKMLVDCGGYKVWGSVPTAISDVQRGSTVAFTATVEQSHDDEAFGIFKRPSKARVTEEPAAE